MPLSRNVAQFNRRVTNRVLGHIAGWMPGFGIVTHIGRRSGRRYRTPINLFQAGDVYRIALTYGPESDWVRNVLAAGGCEIETRRKHIVLAHPRIVDDPRRDWVPPVVRLILRLVNRFVSVPEYMELTVDGTTCDLAPREEDGDGTGA